MTNPPAGFYPDSTNGGRGRWWNGEQWTDRFQDEMLTPPAPAPASAPAPAPTLAVGPTNEMTDVEQPEGTQDTAAPNAISGGSPVSSRPSPSHRTWLMITIGAFVLGGLLGGSVAALATAGGPGDDTATSSEADAGGVTAIEQAGRRCGLVNMDGRSTASGVEVGDGGMSLTLDTKGNDDSTGIAYSDAECMFTQLKMTDAIKSRVEATRALDGRQTGDWGDFDASWGYHPDHGLDMVIEDQS